jgi:hypothetical protein
VRGLEIERLEKEGLRGLSFLSLTKETFRFYTIICSCIVELREAVTISWIFSTNRDSSGSFCIQYI